EQVLHKIAFFLLSRAFARRHSNDSFAAASLRAEGAYRSAFDKPAVGDADDATFVSDQVFHQNLAFVRHQLRQPRGGVFVANFSQLFFDDGENALLFGQDVAQV